ncbi:hypothetical protein [Nonomuraea sp. NPDC050783]|uniref:hypothetical protein n=1 Tax=Nonomuraea sp. NPDC050783 TaxID=3154634 RepID=UPI00346787D6
MRRLAAVILVLALSGCAGGETGEVALRARTPAASSTASPMASPSPGAAASRASSLSCEGSGVALPAVPDGLLRAGTFARLPALARPLDVRGLIWSSNDERLYVGVVCGPRTAEEFATLVPEARLTAYEGRPALRWTTRIGVRNLMWLESPGVAVYVGATPGLTAQMRSVADGIGHGPALGQARASDSSLPSRLTPSARSSSPSAYDSRK